MGATNRSTLGAWGQCSMLAPDSLLQNRYRIVRLIGHGGMGAVYRAVAAGEPGDDYPTFRAGHVENVLGEAVALSNTDQRWVEVTT